MKRIWVAITLLIIAFIFSITEFIYVDICYNKYTKLLKDCKNYISTKEYSDAYETCKHTLSEWENTEKTLNIFLIHGEVDSITESIAQLKICAKNNDTQQFDILYEKAKRQLLSIKKSELPVFENIL